MVQLGQRGDRYVWPTTDTLAYALGYLRGDKITPCIRELERLQALTVIKVPAGQARRCATSTA
ncbi:hypothetical protein [Streptomyces sp. NPDC017993]|uniref:hypothetical protein n=1 Tax=Streptomyces sp. NPDC017993 TaxID=3365027 RepID=UPI0037A97422